VILEGISESSLSQERMAINDIAEQALTAASMIHAAADLDFALELDPNAGWVYVDRSRLNQALDNLLNNAIKFTPPGGRITLRTCRLPDGREVEIRVSDTGIGIAPEYLERVFQRFYQVKDPARRGAGGSGIGLAIVQKVVQAHRGRVWVESEKGSGSHFMIVLPSLPEVPDDGGPEEGV
jgi:signal transduction histidine kinase